MNMSGDFPKGIEVTGQGDDMKVKDLGPFSIGDAEKEVVWNEYVNERGGNLLRLMNELKSYLENGEKPDVVATQVAGIQEHLDAFKEAIGFRENNYKADTGLKENNYKDITATSESPIDHKPKMDISVDMGVLSDVDYDHNNPATTTKGMDDIGQNSDGVVNKTNRDKSLQ